MTDKTILRTLTEDEIKRSFSWFHSHYYPKPKTGIEYREMISDWINHLIKEDGLVVIEDGRALSNEELRNMLDSEADRFVEEGRKEKKIWSKK